MKYKPFSRMFSQGKGELKATIIDVTELVQAAEEQAAEAVKRAKQYQVGQLI
jgi:hypothetical protein